MEEGSIGISKKNVMEIIPAIDLLDGNCVRLNQGNYNKVTQFNQDPLAQAKKWQDQGATRLHLVDLDGAKTGKPFNDSIIKSIVSKIDIPVQLGGGIRTRERAEELINYGLDRVILGTVAIEEPSLVEDLSKRNPGKIIVGIDAKDGKVATRGWINKSHIDATELARNLRDLDLAAIISTDISTDGTLNGPNCDSLKSICSTSNIPIIASGGVGSIADLYSLMDLKEDGVVGIIIGRALYDETINLSEAIKAVSSDRIEDIQRNQGTFFA